MGAGELNVVCKKDIDNYRQLAFVTLAAVYFLIAVGALSLIHI